MSAQITINPNLTTNAPGSFNVSSDGLIQGTAYDSPNTRYDLAGGVLHSTATLPMWGGVAISENIPISPAAAGAPRDGLGGIIDRATNVVAGTQLSITGFAVFDQDHSMINSPQSPVPLAPSGGQVNFYRLGSGARIAVKCDAALALFAGDVITTPVSWDFTSQMLVPAEPVIAENQLLALTWASTSGGQATGSTTTNHGVAVGQEFTLSGNVPTGYNGSYVAITGTTGNILKFALATNPGTVTTLGKLDGAGGTLNVRVIDVKIGNCMTVVYDPVTGFATWNRNDNCAVILI